MRAMEISESPSCCLPAQQTLLKSIKLAVTFASRDISRKRSQKGVILDNFHQAAASSKELRCSGEDWLPTA